MRKFFETLSVFVANVLRLKPISWKESQEEVSAMHIALAKWQGSSKVEVDGKEITPTPPITPFGLLADCTLNALAFVLAVWLIVKIVGGFLVWLPALLFIAALAWALGVFTKPKGQNPAS